MKTARIPEEAAALYEAGRNTDGPWAQGPKVQVIGRKGFELVANVNGQSKALLDFHGQILCESLGLVDVASNVRERIRSVGMSVLGPDFTHPIIDQTQMELAEALKAEYGEDFAVAFHSSGTRANENALRLARAFLGGRLHALLLREGYHGGGLMNALCGHASWKGQSTVSLGTPVTFLDHAEDVYDKRNYDTDLERALQTDVASDARPFLMVEGGVQGVAGFQELDPKSVQHMVKAVHEKGGVVLFDCVQTMPWRTGESLFTTDGLIDKKDAKTIPDMVTSAKGNGAGFAFAFLAVRKGFFDQIRPEQRAKDYDTFGRTLEGAAACHEVLKVVSTPDFQRGIRESGVLLRKGLEELLDQFEDKVIEVTGPAGGLMQGLELDSAKRVTDFRKVGLTDTGLVVAVGGVRGNILRLGFRLDSPPEIIAEGLRRIEETLKKI